MHAVLPAGLSGLGHVQQQPHSSMSPLCDNNLELVAIAPHTTESLPVSRFVCSQADILFYSG